jgi:tripartite ATP-independent transporter DctM subunit
MEWYLVAIAIVIILFALLLVGVPVSISLGTVSLGTIILLIGFDGATNVVAGEAAYFLTNYSLIAIPMFVLMGELLFVGGTADNIFDIASAWLRRIPGGIALVAVGTSAIFATLSGASIGALATVAVLTIPQMLKRGYSKRLATGSVGAAGGLAHLIPPSILMVLYASIVEVPIGQALMAGVLPGILLGATYAAVVIGWAKLRPDAAPREPEVSWRQRFSVLRKGIGPLFVIFAVTGTIFLGIATATEASALGAAAALILAVGSKKVKLAQIWQCGVGAAKTTSFILLIAMGGALLSWVLSYLHVPTHMLSFAQNVEVNRWWIVLAVMAMYLILGAFIDPVGMIIITMPVVAPLMVSLGFDPLWFGVLLMINIELALITPPLGIGLYIVKGVSPKEVELNDVLYGCSVFFIADIIVLGLVMIFPQIALWLPSQMF